MTMQRQDYLRISKSLRMTRDRTLREIDMDDKPTRTIVRASYRALAVQLARSFRAVNERFHYERFFRDALGHTDSALARDEFEQLTDLRNTA